MRISVFTSWSRLFIWYLTASVITVACTPGGVPSQPTMGIEVQPETPSAVPEIQPTPAVIEMTIVSQGGDSEVTVRIVEATPVVAEDAEPIIFTQIGIDQKCGHGDVVAADGHLLRATPRLLSGNSNVLELLPEGARVDIIDCRLWTDQEGLNWLAVRTPEKKLGWMLLQPDKFYVTLYPVPLELPKALTGIPAGTTVAYVPPSDCRSGPVSNGATATSIGVDFIPVVGDVKGLTEAATGCDLVTGESLGNWRWLGLLGLIGLSEVALLRHSDEAADGLRTVDNLEGSLRYSDEVTMSAMRNADSASDFIRAMDQLENVPAASGDTVRALEGGWALSDEAVQALAKLEQPCSFSSETPVAAVTGLVPISQIEPGDQVLAYDEVLGVTGYYTVTASFAHVDATIITLTIGTNVLETTPTHPFYVNGEWVQAADLDVGDVILAASGAVVPVEHVEVSYRTQMMYNLTVSDAHTYFVGVGKWLVHNACSRILRRNLGKPAWSDEVAEWQAHHIIPGQWEDHPFAIRAAEGGWNVDGARNGIALPTADADAARLGLPAHRGPHPAYSELVRRELDSLEDRALVEGWDSLRAAAEMNKLTNRMRQYILRRAAGQQLPY